VPHGELGFGDAIRCFLMNYSDRTQVMKDTLSDEKRSRERGFRA